MGSQPSTSTLLGLLKLAALLVPLFIVQPSLAQYKVIDVDSVTKQPSQQLPFDEPFTLRIPIKSLDVSGVYCFELARHRTLQETLTQRMVEDITLHFPSFPRRTAAEESGYTVETVGKVRYLIVHMNARGASTIRLAQGIKGSQDSKATAQNIMARNNEALATANLTSALEATPPVPAQINTTLKTLAEAHKVAVRAAKQTRQNRLLNPGREYAFLWSGTTVSEDTWLAADRYRLYQLAQQLPLHQVNRNSLITAENDTLLRAYTRLFENAQKQTGLTINLPSVPQATASDFKNLFEPTPPKPLLYSKAEYDKLEGLEQVAASVALTIPSTEARSAYNKVARYILQETPQFDSQLKASFLPEPKKASQRVLALSTLTAASSTATLAGYQPLDCNDCERLHPYKEKRKYQVRLANLKSSLTGLGELYVVVHNLALSDASIYPAETHLNDYRKALQDAITKLTAVLDQRKIIEKRLASFQLNTYQTLGASTSSLSFEARTKLSIGPDFGVVTTKPFSSNKNPYSFVPYLGFHVNFRPYNREIPYVLYPHKFLHRLSAVVGWSLVNIDNGPKLAARADQDSITSFFKNKGTLMTGFGIRLSSAVQFTVGSMWYFRYQREESMSTTPLRYIDRHLRAWPYMGITVDLSLKDILNDITAILPSAPRSYTPAASPPTVPN